VTMSIFSRNRKGDDEDKPVMESESELDLPAKPASRPTAGGTVPSRPQAVPPMWQDPAKPPEIRPPQEAAKSVEAPRRALESSLASAHKDTAIRKLTVGQEISLQGEIKSCDYLVIEGSVSANLTDCRDVEILETGLFKGSADIEQVEVRGLFEGELNVRGRLLIRATGKVTGTVRYGQIEIELGGQISGDVQAEPPKAGNGAAPSENRPTTPAGIF
jgi:cytoskeletal protein CcmA (bactofilin family)